MNVISFVGSSIVMEHPALERVYNWFAAKKIDPRHVIQIVWRGTIDTVPPQRYFVLVTWDEVRHVPLHSCLLQGSDAYIAFLTLVIGLELPVDRWPRDACPDLDFDADWIPRAQQRHDAYHIELAQREPRYKEYMELVDEEVAIREAECELGTRRQSYQLRMAAFAANTQA